MIPWREQRSQREILRPTGTMTIPITLMHPQLPMAENSVSSGPADIPGREIPRCAYFISLQQKRQITISGSVVWSDSTR
jgi:hypothetical protein